MGWSGILFSLLLRSNKVGSEFKLNRALLLRSSALLTIIDYIFNSPSAFLGSTTYEAVKKEENNRATNGNQETVDVKSRYA